MPKKKKNAIEEDELNVNQIEIDISKIKPNPSNPRIIKDDRFEKLVKSIKDFPKMMELRPIIVDSNNMILGGNMRLKALNYLSYKKIPKSWIKQASDLTDKEKEQFWKKPTAIPLGGSHRPDVEYLLLFRKSAIWNNAVEGVSYSRCLEFDRELSKDHPTLKPIALIENELKISSNLGSIVCEFFLGSGSTIIACEKTGRKCYGMEIDPKYCQVTIDRVLRLDPSIIVKKNGKPFIINNQKPN